MNSKTNDSAGPNPAATTATFAASSLVGKLKTTLKNSIAALGPGSCGFPSYYPGKARDLFESCENVMPLNFDGLRALSLNKLRPKCNDYEIYVGQTVNISSINPGAYYISALLKHNRGERFCTSAALDVDPSNGNWNAEVGHKSRLMDCVVDLQVHKWRNPIVSRVRVDYKKPNYTITGHFDPIKNVTRLQTMLVSERKCVRDRHTRGGCLVASVYVGGGFTYPLAYSGEDALALN